MSQPNRSRYFILFDGRAEFSDTDDAVALESIGIRDDPPWSYCRKEWSGQRACLYSYQWRREGNRDILTDEYFEGVIE